jgi:DNA-binding transcriptional LysR family regulator
MTQRHGSTRLGAGAAAAYAAHAACVEAFLATVHQGSLTAAAHHLGLTQPGVSRQIARLEQALGTSLLVRGRQGVALTAAGERYRAYAEDALARHALLLEELRDGDAVLSGPLRIAASTTPSEVLVPGLVARFTALHPDVQATVCTADSLEVVEHVRLRRWDIGFAGVRVDRMGLRFEPVATDEIVLAVPRHHPFARRATVPLAALEGQVFIAREDGSGTMLSVARALAERGQQLPAHRVRMTLGTTQAIVAAVRDGYGIGFVSSLALAELAGDRVATVRLVGAPLRRALYLVVDERRVLSAVPRAFAAFCVRQASA